jgi:hypothetical protein
MNIKKEELKNYNNEEEFIHKVSNQIEFKKIRS